MKNDALAKFCRDCRYWEANTPESTSGLCRRRCPQAVVTETDCICTVFPETVATEWCGEFDRRDLDFILRTPIPRQAPVTPPASVPEADGR